MIPSSRKALRTLALRRASARRTRLWSSSVTPFSTRSNASLLHQDRPRSRRRTRSLQFAASQQERSATTLAILRETYNPWERRVPLTPHQVSELLRPDDPASAIDEIVVQPSSQRIFSNADYVQAGATLSDDVSKADIVLGVKRPKDETDLLPNKSYIFFSHTIKGQPENMALLQHCLENDIQLIDYERMYDAQETANGIPPKRLVTFGRFAGLAGAIDTLGALGRRLLYSKQLTTPFLNCPPAWMNTSLQQAQERVQEMAVDLQHAGVPTNEPIVIAVTGQGGTVHSGAMEVLQLLPHEVVSVEDLPKLFSDNSNNKADLQNKVYLVPVSMQDIFERRDVVDHTSFFDPKHYTEHPQLYRCMFAERVAPYCQAIVNCVYWDERFPRLLTKQQLSNLAASEVPRLLLVSDLSCDVGGSMEFLERSTTIERPFFQYHPTKQRVVADEIGASGITVMGVDILPSELPRDSSRHFGTKVKEVVRELAELRNRQETQERGVDPELLGPRLASAVITTRDGQLAPLYQYLEPLMLRALELQEGGAASEGYETPSNVMVLSLEGHLFDSGLINHMLDVIENHQAGLEFEDFLFPNHHRLGTSLKSRVTMRITAPDETALDEINHKLVALVEAIPKADATMTRLDGMVADVVADGASDTATVSEQRPQKVLLLGSGRVAKCFVDYLNSESKNVEIVVASDNQNEARDIMASTGARGRHVRLNAAEDLNRVSQLVQESDLVVSLLPAPLHPPVAEECLRHGVHFCTASYESEAMRAMHDRAAQAGLVFLNEVGLDPGLDHMSAMKLIDEIQQEGGKVVGFSSVCGGLPAPEAAADNPLQYKFSWNPRGVLQACQNPAQYRWNGELVQVNGRNLLKSGAVEPFLESQPWDDLRLECLPNRDSLKYGDVYGIDDTAQTLFRGTLRYQGFSKLMNTFLNMGLLDFDGPEVPSETKWKDILDMLRAQHGMSLDCLPSFMDKCADDDIAEARRAMQALEWLDILGDQTIGDGGNGDDVTVLDAFCKVLENKLRYGEGERDMVVMHHNIAALFDADRIPLQYQSSLQVFGCEERGTAMAKTVGYTTAAAAQLVLDADTALAGVSRGLVLPTIPEIYNPVLDQMEKTGIVFEERVIDSSCTLSEASGGQS